MKKIFDQFTISFLGIVADVMFYLFSGWLLIGVVMILYLFFLNFTGVSNPPIRFLNTGVMSFLYASFGIFIFYQLKLFMKNMSRKNYFSRDTVLRVRLVGFGLIALSIAEIVVNISYFPKLSSLAFGDLMRLLLFNLKFAIVGLIVLGISNAFCYGKSLQEENSLTI